MKQLIAQMGNDVWDALDQFPIDYRCALVVDYVPSDNRTRDVDGMLSALCYVLAKAGIVKDDGLIRDVMWHEYPMDREHPMATVTIRSLT